MMDIAAVKRMTKKVEAKITEKEAGDAGEMATVIIRVAAILVIGVVILNGVAESAALSEGDAFYNLSQSVISNVESGYTLAALMVLALGASVIMRYMGFL